MGVVAWNIYTDLLYVFGLLLVSSGNLWIFLELWSKYVHKVGLFSRDSTKKERTVLTLEFPVILQVLKSSCRFMKF